MIIRQSVDFVVEYVTVKKALKTANWWGFLEYLDDHIQYRSDNKDDYLRGAARGKKIYIVFDAVEKYELVEDK